MHEYDRHIQPRRVAKELGERTYQGLNLCATHGERPIRYTCNGACLLCVQAYSAAKKKANEEAERIRKREWKRANTNKTAAQRARHVAKHPDKIKASGAHYRARRDRSLSGPGNDATYTGVMLILRIQGHRCAYCGEHEDVLHLDHMVSVYNGGKHTLSNLQWLCAWHNVSKGKRNDDEYRTAEGIPYVTPWEL